MGNPAPTRRVPDRGAAKGLDSTGAVECCWLRTNRARRECPASVSGRSACFANLPVGCDLDLLRSAVDVADRRRVGRRIAREILLDEAGPPGDQFNLRWCQIPDLQALLGTTLGRRPNDPRRSTVLGQALNDPRGSTVVMLNWREVGF
jgi:hypothetical protein